MLRGASQTITVEPFKERHGLSAFMVAPTAIIRGVGLTCGMEILGDKEVPGMTGYYDSNLEGKMLFAVDASANYDFGFVHIKAVDDAGHDRDFDMKVKQLEKTDQALGKMLEKFRQQGRDALVCITGDHTTPVRYGDHSHEPVPICIGSVMGKVRRDAHFDELQCASGRLGRFSGSEIIGVLKKLSI